MASSGKAAATSSPTKVRMLLRAMHSPSTTQWWSKPTTHASHVRQWCEPRGRSSVQTLHIQGSEGEVSARSVQGQCKVSARSVQGQCKVSARSVQGQCCKLITLGADLAHRGLRPAIAEGAHQARLSRRQPREARQNNHGTGVPRAQQQQPGAGRGGLGAGAEADVAVDEREGKDGQDQRRAAEALLALPGRQRRHSRGCPGRARSKWLSVLQPLVQ
eukprot:scaffold66600_cov62-Phaeocystis_antarctica.AAC.3